MNNKKQLVAFIGLKQTGKGYNSEFYIKNGFIKISLADSLREMLWEIIGFSPSEYLPYNEYKKCTLTTKISTKSKFIPWLKEIKITTIRKMMQNLGSVMKKHLGQDFWVNLWYNKVVRYGCNIVCDDVRFVNEILKILELKKQDFEVTFIWTQYERANYSELLKDEHSSEALSKFMYENRKKYGLYDCCTISHSKIKQICEDFESIV